MNPPTLTLGARVVTLPHPHAATSPQLDWDVRAVRRRTIGGRLRTTVLSDHFVYRLEFRLVPQATYSDIRALWLDAIAAGDYPTFDFPAMWPTAVSVRVSVVLSAAATPLAGRADLVSFALDLEEADPR